ncbi:hypothetical protein [Schlesneria paludicola]|uniref:hypothetical protein n=1 Tax=Schlesneria paludicola TaxID=360056 RepID=UPI00029B2F7E|nr:hypothetical protein [Schlesneria paludicola]
MGIRTALDDKDHTSNLIAAVSALATVIFGSFSIGFSLYCWQLQRNDLAETKTQSKLDLKEQTDRFQRQLDQFEKAHHLEVTPRLQLEIDSWRETPLGMMKIPTVKLINTGRGTAYDIVVDTYVERFEYLELPSKEREKFQEMYEVLPGEVRVTDVDTSSLAGNRLIDHRTVRPNDALDGLAIRIPFSGGNHIQGIGGYAKISFTDEDGSQITDFQQFFAFFNMSDSGTPYSSTEFKSARHQKDWTVGELRRSMLKGMQQAKSAQVGSAKPAM